MPKVAPDVLKTDPPISTKGKATFRAIADRLMTLNPPLVIEAHIAQTEKQDAANAKWEGDEQFSTLKAYDAPLDGINFVAVDPKALAKRLDDARDEWGAKTFTSMKEDPKHWALQLSFMATVGTGWREVWRPDPYTPPGSTQEKPTGTGDDTEYRSRFGDAGTPITYTALHCAVHEVGGKCNIHIDKSGFVLGLPKGVSLTFDMYDHIVNELKLKTDFRNWLVGKESNSTAERAFKEVIRRLQFQFPNAANGYAGLSNKIGSLRRPGTPLDAGWQALKFAAPTGVTFDLVDNEHVKVQAHGTWHSGDRTISLSVGGNW